MSGKLVGKVYDIYLPHDEQAIMIALADHGNDFGEHIHPSVDYLAWKTGYHRRNVQRILRKLTEKRLLIPVAYGLGGRGNPTVYEMRLENGTAKPPFERHKKGGEDATVSDNDETQKGGGDATVSPQKGGEETTVSPESGKGRHLIHKRVASHTQRVASHTQKGGVGATRTVIEPSYEPSEEPAHTRDPLSQAKKVETPDPDPEADPPQLRGAPPTLYGVPVGGPNHRDFQLWLAGLKMPNAEKYQPQRRHQLMSEYFDLAEGAEVHA